MIHQYLVIAAGNLRAPSWSGCPDFFIHELHHSDPGYIAYV